MMFAERTLDFDRDGQDWPNQDWPNREASRFVEAAGIRWHVQDFGTQDGGEPGLPVLLLIHGTGAATHSWRGLVPLLRQRFRLVALDLPGHGFTQRPPTELFTLPGMAAGVAAVLAKLDAEAKPAVAVGHSAGAAVVLRMALDRTSAPRGLVSLNGALRPYGGDAARWLSPVAKLLFLNPLTPRLFAWRSGDADSVARLIRNTGSTIDAAGAANYRTLVNNPDHVAAALGMMANWDLQPLARDLPKIAVPLLLIAGRNDRTIKAEDNFVTRDLVPGARVAVLPNLGHLAHEEAPDAVARLILAFAEETGASMPHGGIESRA